MYDRWFDEDKNLDRLGWLGQSIVVTRAGQNARGSLARSVHGQLGSARLGSFEFFHELS
jgi:hypothetical protein